MGMIARVDPVKGHDMALRALGILLWKGCCTIKSRCG